MKTLLLLALLFLCPFLIHSQILDEKTITADFQDLSLATILKQLEADEKFVFYYRPEDLSGRTLRFSFEDTPLRSVLDQLMEDTELAYSVYRDYAIIIAPKALVEEMYTAAYYAALENSITKTEEEEERRDRKNSYFEVGSLDQLGPNGQANLKARVINRRTKAPVIGATIRWTGQEGGDATDVNGQFERSLSPGKYEILIEYIGYRSHKAIIDIRSDGEIEIELRREATNLQEVVVEAEKADVNISDNRASITRLDVKSLQKLPTVFGEADVLKSLLLYAGVSTTGEGSTGINVRGGDVDQNLILQDETFLFNSSHALGFFSTFNADLISKVDLYKSIIPAVHGGRLASVLDVQMRDGNYERYKLKGGIGPVSSRVAFEGPVIKDKSSFIVGFRASYADWLLRLISVPEVQNSSAFFYDANFRYSHRINDKHSFSLSGYGSSDDFNFNQEFGFQYETYSGQLIYKSILSDKVFNKLSLVYSNYTSEQSTEDSELESALLRNQINYYKIKEQLSINGKDDQRWDFGFSGIYYLTDPGERLPLTPNSLIPALKLEREKGLESAIFIQNQLPINDRLEITAGLRYSFYQFLGPKTVINYQNPEEPRLDQVIDTTLFSSGAQIASYGTLEPRLSGLYRLNETTSIKFGYSRTAQYINQIFNSDSPTPTSQFQLSTNTIPPQRSHNFSLGYFRNFTDNTFETSFEVYYRNIDQLYDYKDFADIAVNPQLETELRRGKGRAYGVELNVEKKKGRFNGRLSYTLSRTERLIDGINEGNWYPGNFDRPHDLTLILNLKQNEKHSFSLNFNYGTGRPITGPIGTYRIDGALLVPIYSDRNGLRIPDYHRLDLSYTIGRGYNKNKKLKTSWTFSVYNVYSRRNAYTVFFKQSQGLITKGNQLSILGSAFPAITVNFYTI